MNNATTNHYHTYPVLSSFIRCTEVNEDGDILKIYYTLQECTNTGSFLQFFFLLLSLLFLGFGHTAAALEVGWSVLHLLVPQRTTALNSLYIY